MSRSVHHRADTRSGRALAGLVAILIAVMAACSSDVRAAQKQVVELPSTGATLAVPADWTALPYGDGYQLINAAPDVLATLDNAALENVVRIVVTTEHGRDHAEIVRRLGDIASEQSSPVSFQQVGAWPSLERRQTMIKPRRGDEKGDDGPDVTIIRFTMATGAGEFMVRFDATLPENASPQLVNEVRGIGRSVSFRTPGDPDQSDREIQQLRNQPKRAPVQSQSFRLPTHPAGVPEQGAAVATAGATALASTPGSPESNPGAAQVVLNGNSEIEVIASTSGRNIVVAAGRNFSTSNDGGQTFPFTGGLPFSNFGDVSLAFARSGNFYFAGINNTAGCGGSPLLGCATGINVSTNNGQTFAFRSNAVQCATSGGSACFPDQEHIAADRFNSAPGGDQVYSAWRNFPGPTQMITCSADGGTTWPTTRTIGGGDFGRVTVGQDGFVYLTYRNGNSVMVNKYSSCSAGFVQQGSAATVASVTDVFCPVPGLDRCNSGNLLSSHVAAVDDTDPNHVFVAYATNTLANNTPGNEDIIVQDSLDGGASFPAARAVRVNTSLNARRFMPWVCAVGGTAHVSWYDRRATTSVATSNDLSDYFRASAFLDGAGNLVAGPELQVNPPGSADAQCAAGQATGSLASWNCSTRATTDSESCSQQPQLAGLCCVTSTCGAGDSQQQCDFSSTTCPTGESCQVPSPPSGCPKYGDYSGNACAAGRVLNAWATATAGSPVFGLAPSGGIDVVFNSKLVCCAPQIQVPGSVSLDDACVGSSTTATLNVCNTGMADLVIDPNITSSNAQFSVTAPSSGYPVTISPDFCFPFQVRFTPTSTGAKSATLTIPSNDTVNPSVTVQATGKGIQQRLATLIADSGSFGNVCRGDIKDLALTLSNSGGCDLTVSHVTSSSGDFLVAGTQVFPIVIGPGDSIQIPIRFQPTTLGVKAGNITVASDDPTSPLKVVAVSGIVPSGNMTVTGSTDFGDVCAGTQAEKTVSVCNTGSCDLHVTSVAFSPACPDFTLVNNPFPATVSHDFCLGVVIRFTPTSAGPKSCTLVIMGDDPVTPVKSLTVTANTPIASIDVPPDLGFPATVIQSIGACKTPEPFPVSNKGQCNLNITNFAITNNATEYSLAALPSFPIILQPGHVAGDGALQDVFGPATLDRARTGNVTVTYESDPITHTTQSVTRAMCGEAVRTGARVLVRAGGVPLAIVDKIQLQRINANRNKTILDTNDVIQNAALQTVVPGAPCAPFQFQREYGTVSNPIQLLPGSYQVTVSATVGKKKLSKTVGFNVDTCGFNANIVVDF
ncbi:MAG TPA: choice-of-anchor D domain-containing protein [Verrucomicrobiae bacterium]|nr:choice-of-anchor D domain-containing protein [Verrucomicrobiae bacterium]